MCTALPLDEVYLLTKFHNHSYYTFGDMLRTKFKYENKQRAITQKLKKQELRFMCTQSHLTRSIHPQKFHNHRWYRFGDMLHTKNWTRTARLDAMADPIIHPVFDRRIKMQRMFLRIDGDYLHVFFYLLSQCFLHYLSSSPLIRHGQS